MLPGSKLFVSEKNGLCLCGVRFNSPLSKQSSSRMSSREMILEPIAEERGGIIRELNYLEFRMLGSRNIPTI